MRRASAGYLPLPSNLPQLLATFMLAMLLVAASGVMAHANPKYAAYVLDAKTGQVLFSRNADARRYPASLTKMMTLYLVFEAMEARRISTKTQIPFSKNAAAEPPTKLGVRAGGSVSVDIAIKALVTRSANDVSTAIAEMIGGSESGFARLMTTKARQLGMNSTQFRNAHGLPNSDQFTTARDMAILGVALREHFPQYYDYFSTRSFKYGKQKISTHNRMFGRIKGVDGIKTGYTRASGFNLVSSAEHNGRSVVAVVMGGKSGRSRDDHMAELLREYMPRASRSGGGELIASQQPVGAATAFALPKTDIPTPSFRPQIAVAAATAPVAAAAVPAAPVPAAAAPVAAYTESVEARFSPPAPVPVPVAQGDTEPVDPMQTASTRPTGWAVQVASSPNKVDALAALAVTGNKASNILAAATPFTEIYDHEGTVYYRARFGGFGSKSKAWDACNALKKRNIDCYAVEL